MLCILTLHKYFFSIPFEILSNIFITLLKLFLSGFSVIFMLQIQQSVLCLYLIDLSGIFNNSLLLKLCLYITLETYAFLIFVLPNDHYSLSSFWISLIPQGLLDYKFIFDNFFYSRGLKWHIYSYNNFIFPALNSDYSWLMYPIVYLTYSLV